MSEIQPENSAEAQSEQLSSSEDLRWVTRLQLHKWMRILALTNLSFACLVVSDNTSLPLVAASVPYILLDLLIVFVSLRLYFKDPSYPRSECLKDAIDGVATLLFKVLQVCLLYTSPSPRDS